jgi:exosortase C (VPDSG-CTERM-specific)
MIPGRMNDLESSRRKASAESRRYSAAVVQGARSRRVTGFLLFAVVSVLLFLKPFIGLVRYALTDDVSSYILLIPFISGYLVWLKRHELFPTMGISQRPSALALFAAVLALAGYGVVVSQAQQFSRNDYLSLTTFAFVCLVVSGGVLFFGSALMRVVAFPVGFLFLMVPPPGFVIASMTSFLQHASAEASYALLQLSGTPVFRDGLVFRLPGISIEVADECSGIRSTLVLLITSLLAGYLFLKNPWRRTALLLAVVPLGVLRNGFRIFTIGMLCAHVGPEMIDSPLHHRGGPVFFVLSLVLLFLLLVFLRRYERRRTAEATPGNPQEQEL